MLKKHTVLIGIIIALLLLTIATFYYPGGSQRNAHSTEYEWTNNYLCSLFGYKAVNGANNTARYWAIPGMLFLSASFALFFNQVAKKIPQTGAAKIVKRAGIGSMLFAFGVVTPYHDTAVIFGSTFALLSMFYIIVFVFKTRLHWLKVLSVVCILMIYICVYSYSTRSFIWLLPILQKASLVLTITWIMALQYFTTQAHFQSRKQNIITV